jgi:Carboxymuconolactone decarboxylase family
VSRLIPRLSIEEMNPGVRAALEPRIERLGYLGEFFRCAAHQPQALLSFMAFTEDLKLALPDNLTEVVALSVASFMGNAYERVQHERLSLKLGFSPDWVREVISLAGDGTQMSTPELTVQKLALAVIERRGHNTARQLEAAIVSIGHEQAVAVLMLIGRYVTHALMVNCLDLAPPVSSPFE